MRSLLCVVSLYSRLAIAAPPTAMGLFWPVAYVSCPSLPRFTVTAKRGVVLAHAVCPVSTVRPGFRSLPLCNEFGEPIPNASVLFYVEVRACWGCQGFETSGLPVEIHAHVAGGRGYTFPHVSFSRFLLSLSLSLFIGLFISISFCNPGRFPLCFSPPSLSLDLFLFLNL